MDRPGRGGDSQAVSDARHTWRDAVVEARLGATATLAAFVIADRIRGDRTRALRDLSISLLARRMGVDRTTAGRAIARLQAAGLIEYTAGGHGTAGRWGRIVIVIPGEAESITGPESSEAESITGRGGEHHRARRESEAESITDPPTPCNPVRGLQGGGE